MALKKVSEVAKNAGISVEEALKVLQASGVHVSNGNDTVKDEDVTAAGLDKRGQLDRRQEMLQKALERHKKGVKIKEVVVNNKNTGSQQEGPNIKLSKEELKKRKKLMEQHIKKVDEDRIQYNKEKAAQQQNSEQSAKETAVKQEAKETHTTASADVKPTAAAANNNEAAKNVQKPSHNQNAQS